MVSKRLLTSNLLFATGIICFVAFMLHLIIFWTPYDGRFLLHRILLSTTAALCAVGGACIYLDFSPTMVSRAEARLHFVLVYLVLLLLMLVAYLCFLLTWGTSEFVDGMKMENLLEDYETVIVIIILVLGGIAIFLLLVVVIVNTILLMRDWRRVAYDD